MIVRIASTILLALIIFIETGCQPGNDHSAKVPSNDTTEIIRQLVYGYLYRQNTLDIDLSQKNIPFGDSLVFIQDSLLTNHLPAGYKVKILTADEICSQATQYCNDTLPFAGFVKLNYLRKTTDTTYEAAVQNACVISLFDKTGRPRFGVDTTKHPTMRCSFDFSCGKELVLSFSKQRDTLMLTTKQDLLDK